MITIKGEEGKALDAVELDFASIASSGTLSFSALAIDELTFSISPEFIRANESLIPEEGQEVSLFIASERVFRGTVNRVANDWGSGSLSVEVTVSGPWWWLEQTALSELTEDDVERSQFRCELGEIEGHITRLFDRLKDLGVPVDLGELDACYEIPTTTFRDASFARALSELLRLVPDAIGWWDYSGAGDPLFRLSRRSVDSAEAFTLGVDPVVSGNLEANFGLKVERVSVPYAERLETGETTFREQSAGTGSGTRQVMTVSGPELVDFVPPDPIDGVTVSTDDMFSGVDLNPAGIQSVRSIWKEFIDRFSPVPVPTTRLWVDGDVTGNSQRYVDGVEPKILDEDGVEITSATDFDFIVIPEDLQAGLPSWFSEVLEVQTGTLTGTIFVEDFNAQANPVPDRIKFLIANADFTAVQANAPNNDYYIFSNVEIPVTLVKAAIVDVSYYKPLAYIFEAPPANFAENLRFAQSWLPYSGSVELEWDDFQRYSGSTVNLANGRQRWETMGALVQGETFDLFSQRQTLNLGVPARFSGSTPVTRLQRSSSDSVVLL